MSTCVLGIAAGLGLIAGPSMARAQVADARAAGAEPAPRPFDVYLGQAPRRIQSVSRVEGARSRYAFEPVLQGDEVCHAFVIANESDEPLEILKVQTCSGCFLDGYSKRIEPGREGRVAFVVPTDALGGREIDSPVTIWTSSEQRPEIRVDVSLVIREFAKLEPYRVWLKGRPGEPIVAKALVTPSDAYPFSVVDVRARKGIWFEWSFEEIVVDGRRAYAIELRNTRSRPGPYQDVLFVQTDHPERPELKIRVEGRLAEHGVAPTGD